MEGFIARHWRGLRASLLEREPGRRLRNWMALALVAAAPALVWWTLTALSEDRATAAAAIASPSSLRTVFLLDLVYILVAAGLLVGFGSRLGSGCTSGHGVCGIARLSVRSIVATLTFTLVGVVTVALLRLTGVLS